MADPTALQRFHQARSTQPQQPPAQPVPTPPTGGDPNALHRFHTRRGSPLDQSGVLQQQRTPLIDRIGRAIKGERQPGVEELPARLRVGDREVDFNARLALARGNPLALADIASKQLPGTTIEHDEISGMPMVNIGPDANVSTVNDGLSGPQRFDPLTGRYYLNRPGLSPADVTQGVFEVSAGLVGGLPAAATKPFLGRLAVGGAGQAAASVGIDKAAQMAGSEQPVDQRMAGIAAAFGVGGELLTSGISLLTSMYRNTRMVAPTGELTAHGRELLERAGLDPRAATPEVAAYFRQQADAAVAPEAALARSEAQALPVPVELTQGQVTRDAGQQANEYAMLGGARGDEAKQVMGQFVDTQQSQLRANVPELTNEITGGQTLARGEGAGVAQQAVRDASIASKAGVNEAYDAARATRAQLPSDAIKSFKSGIEREMAGEFPFGQVGEFSRYRQRLANLRQFGKGDGGQELGRLENWRKALNNDIDQLMSGVAPGQSAPPEAAALLRLKKGYDDWLGKSIDDALVSGDPGALEAWTKARGLRARHGELFQSDKVIEKLAARELTPEQSAQYIFGAGRLGANADMIDTLRKMKSILGENSEGWKALQGEGFLQLTRNIARAADFGTDITARRLSGANLANDFDKAVSESRSIMGELFTPEQIGRIRQFRNVLVRATVPKREGPNRSNSGLELGRMSMDALRSVIGSTFGDSVFTRLVGAAGLRLAGGIPERIANASAANAIASRAVVPPLIPKGLGAALGNPGSNAVLGAASLLRDGETRTQQSAQRPAQEQLPLPQNRRTQAGRQAPPI